MKTGLELIAEERKRQIEVLGYTAQEDSKYTTELFQAACCYYAAHRIRALGDGTDPLPSSWPWDEEHWKPSPNDRIKELIKAGALFQADYDLRGFNAAKESIQMAADEIDNLQKEN